MEGVFPPQTVLYGVVHVTYSHVHLYIASCLQRQKVNQEDWVLRWHLCVESHKFCFLFRYSLGPKMVDPILTFVLPISICINLTLVNGTPGVLSCEKKKPISWSGFDVPIQRMNDILQTACSKSPDIPMESSNCSAGMSRALQTSSLQFTNACIQSTYNRLWKPTQIGRLLVVVCDEVRLDKHLKIFWCWRVVFHSYCHQTWKY